MCEEEDFKKYFNSIKMILSMKRTTKKEVAPKIFFNIDFKLKFSLLFYKLLTFSNTHGYNLKV